MTSDWKKAVVTIDTDPKANSYLTNGGKAKKVGKTVKNSIDAYGI